MKKASFDHLNKLFEITAIERHYQTLLTAWNLLAVVREPQPYVLNILPRRLPKVVVLREHFVFKDFPFYERAHDVDTKARQERLDQQEEKRQEGTLRKAPGKKGPSEKGRSFSPVVRPPATKKKKKTIGALKIVSPPPNLSSSSLDSASSRPDSPAQVPDDTSSSPQLDTFHPGTSSSQPEPEFIGLRVPNEPEEERDMNDLRTGFLEKHRKRLNKAIDIVPPPAKRVCPERTEEDSATKAPLSTIPQSNEAGPSTVAATQLDVAGPRRSCPQQCPNCRGGSWDGRGSGYRGRRGGSEREK